MKMKTKNQMVVIRMLKTQSEELDRLAYEYGQSKSDLIREAIQVWLNVQWNKERVRGERDAVA